jgi:ketosteroid isomerase-like protein
MFKKFLLSCLTAAIVLPLPVSVHAATSNIDSQILPLGYVIADRSLPASDVNSIKKEINSLINAINSGDAKKLISHYSKEYQSTSGGRTVTYKDLVEGMEAGAGLMKALGTIIRPEEIKITSIGNNQATAQVSYRVDLKKDSPLRDSAGSKQDRQAVVLITLKKTNGRWLVVSTEAISTPKGVEPTTASNQPANITQQDKQTFTNFFKRHLDALNRKDLNAYLATLDPKSPQYDAAKQETAQLFKEYTLKYAIKSVKVISVDKQEAVVEMAATVKRVSGGGFKDSKMVTTNTLKKINGKWRLHSTTINELTPL